MAGSIAVGGARTTTFLFTDIEGSTRLLQQLRDGYEPLLERYRALVRQAVAAEGGREVGVEGDGLFAVFPSARAGVAAALAAQRLLAAEAWPEGATVRVRMGLHTGEAAERDGDYVGLDVHRAARIAAAAHGGQVLASEVTRTLAEHALPGDVGMDDLGIHHLRDLEQPEHLFQFVAAGLERSFPPPRSAGVIAGNLPTPLTSFIGRDRELALARDLLHRSRLLTLTGPGGAGKTRLALRVATLEAPRFPDGAWFVPLAPIRDAELVPAAVLQALGVPQARDRPPRTHLLEHLATRCLLLLLDNLEQLATAVVPLTSELLSAAPTVRILVTSRTPLHLAGEQELQVPPLGLPDPEHLPPVQELANAEAVALFVERARAVVPDFALTPGNAAAVAAICTRLDGLPLAIELAAARVKLLSPQAMLDRLGQRLSALGTGSRNLPDRHRTLRDTIAWSYDLLDGPARRLLACLAVFSGGWSLELAEEVCDDDSDLLEELATLVDHSLVRQREVAGDVRFWMLETIREFAAGLVTDSGRAPAVRDRHASALLALAEQAAPLLLGRDQGWWTEKLEREHDNFRAALAWLAERGDVARALRLGAALWRFWQKRHVHEGRDRLARLLALDGAEDHPRELAGALEGAGGLAYWRGDAEDARVHYERALAIEETLGDPARIANARYNLAFPFMLGLDRARAATLLDEALAGFQTAGDARGVASVLWGMGVCAFWDGQRDLALERLTESLERARALDDVFLIGWALHMIGAVHLQRGDPDAAYGYLDEAMRLFAGCNDPAAVALMLDDFAQLAAQRGQHERQARLAAASVALQQLSGSELTRLAAAFEHRAAVDLNAFAVAWQEGLAMSMDEAIAYALETQ